MLALRWKQDRPQTPGVLLNGQLNTMYGPESDFQNCIYSPDRKTIIGPGVIDMNGGLDFFTTLKTILESEISDKL